LCGRIRFEYYGYQLFHALVFPGINGKCFVYNKNVGQGILAGNNILAL